MPQHAEIDRRRLLKRLVAAGALATTAGASGLTGGPESVVRGDEDLGPGIDRFEIRVSDEALEDLHRRLESTRWARRAPGAPWALGADRAYLEELMAYWRDKYDWRQAEAALNTFDHYTTTIEGQRIHFVHQKGRGGSSLPLLLTHGWPGTIWVGARVE